MIPTPPQRHIKSFVRREGRLTPKQRQALELLWDTYVLPEQNESELIDWDAIFGRKADLFLEIGFGMGHALIAMAKLAPEKNFLGIEVYRPGIGALLTQLHRNAMTNVRVLYADAAVAIPRHIPDASLAGIHLFFPDPWPKKRHHKRRLVQLPLVKLLTDKLKTHGYLHLATDWEEYALHMLQVLSQVKNLKNSAGPGQFAPQRGHRPLTKYELRGERLGHRVRDILLHKQDLHSNLQAIII